MYKPLAFTKHINLIVIGERIDNEGKWQTYREHRCVFSHLRDWDNTEAWARSLDARADYRGVLTVAEVVLQPIIVESFGELEDLLSYPWGPPMSNAEMFEHLTEVLKEADDE